MTEERAFHNMPIKQNITELISVVVLVVFLYICNIFNFSDKPNFGNRLGWASLI